MHNMSIAISAASMRYSLQCVRIASIKEAEGHKAVILYCPSDIFTKPEQQGLRFFPSCLNYKAETTWGIREKPRRFLLGRDRSTESLAPIENCSFPPARTSDVMRGQSGHNRTLPARRRMSHHFDTKLAKEDPSLNVCDFYLFQGGSNTTVVAMTVNPDVGLSAPDTLHVEGLYVFRFDLNGDPHEEVVFKLRFSEPSHANGNDGIHLQQFQVRRATGDSIGGDQGELLIEG